MEDTSIHLDSKMAHFVDAQDEYVNADGIRKFDLSPIVLFW